MKLADVCASAAAGHTPPSLSSPRHESGTGFPLLGIVREEFFISISCRDYINSMSLQVSF